MAAYMAIKEAGQVTVRKKRGGRQLQIDCSLLPEGKTVLLKEGDEISSSILRAILRRVPEKEQDETLYYEIL